MRNRIGRILGIVLILTSVLAFSACSKETEKKIILGEGDWDSNAFQDEVAKIIIENAYDIKVDAVTADTPIMTSSMKNGTIDVCLELWSDNVVTYDQDLENGDYVELGINFNDNMQGLYIPRYIVEGEHALAPDLKSVKDLKNYPELFKNPEDPKRGIIYGGPEGWRATEFMHKKMDLYGLSEIYDFKTIDSSATLSATLAGAYEKKEPWVGYYWEPTWVLGLYDMVLLEDSEYSDESFEKGEGSFPHVDVTITSRNGFEKDYPELNEFFKKYHTSSAIISEALAYMEQNKAEANEAAKYFLINNQDIWKEWLDEKSFNKVLQAIQEDK